MSYIFLYYRIVRCYINGFPIYVSQFVIASRNKQSITFFWMDVSDTRFKSALRTSCFPSILLYLRHRGINCSWFLIAFSFIHFRSLNKGIDFLHSFGWIIRISCSSWKTTYVCYCVLTVESYLFVHDHSKIFHLFVAQLLSNVFVIFELNDINH
jgi:hypothetical protein